MPVTGPTFPSRPLILGLGDSVIGLTLLEQQPSRESSPAFAGIKQVAPVPAWGALLLGIGMLLLFGIAVRSHVTPPVNRAVEGTVATLAAAWAVFWAVELANTAAADDRVSWTGWELWLFFIVVPHLFLALGREG